MHSKLTDITRKIEELCVSTACLSTAAKLAWRQRVKKNYGACERGRKLELRAARFQRGGSAVVVLAHFFFLFLYNTFVI